jgi:hypothetical protein
MMELRIVFNAGLLIWSSNGDELSGFNATELANELVTMNCSC